MVTYVNQVVMMTHASQDCIVQDGLSQIEHTFAVRTNTSGGQYGYVSKKMEKHAVQMMSAFLGVATLTLIHVRQKTSGQLCESSGDDDSCVSGLFCAQKDDDTCKSTNYPSASVFTCFLPHLILAQH